MEDIVKIAVNNGIGFVCALFMLWVSYFRETKTLPKMSETLQNLSNTFESANRCNLQALKDAQEIQQQTIQTMQEAFGKRNEKTLETFAQLTREERTVYQKWHEENQGRLNQHTLDLKELRHYVKNLSHQLGMKQALDEEMRREKPKDNEHGSAIRQH